MIADTASTSGVKVSGTLTGQKHDLQIDHAAMAHIMSVLTDLYSNPTLAVLREYSTNALDAHIEAGVIAPIEVKLPNVMHPFITIKDHGVGLSEQDIADIYSRYGASTKRSTNDQVGMLGLGCKSALTYAQQFTLASVKDGRRVQVAISRETTGGSMTVVDDSATTESNGTTVTIPARKDTNGTYDTVLREAREFFAYWPKGSVLVNGKPPEEDVWSIEDSMWLVPNKLLIRPVDGRGFRSSAQHRIVMGNVPYPVEAERVPGFKVETGYEVVAFVGIGDVNFVPSREALNYADDRTVKHCEKLSADFEVAARTAVQKNIDAAASRPEAIQAMLSAQKYLREARSYGSYTYKGEKMPEKFQVPGAVFDRLVYPYKSNLDDPQFRLLSVPRRSYVQNQCENKLSVSVESWGLALWVTGYEGKKFSAPQKQKILKYLAEKGLDVTTPTTTTLTGRLNPRPLAAVENIYLLKDEPAAIKQWIAEGRIVSWETINAIKLDRNAAAYGSTKDIPGSYENVTVNGSAVNELAAKDIDTSHPVYWYSGSWYHTRGYAAVLDNHLKGGKYTIVPLPANRKDKFLRNFPKAVELSQAVVKMANEWVAALTDDEKLLMHMRDQRVVTAVKVLDPTKVDDPELKEAVRIANLNGAKALSTRQEFENVIGHLDIPTKTWKNPLTKYPLFNARHLSMGSETTKHTYLYLNAAYAA